MAPQQSCVMKFKSMLFPMSGADLIGQAWIMFSVLPSGFLAALVTVLLFYVSPSEGVRCYLCNSVANSEDCSHVGFCGAGQKCFTQRIIGDGLNDYFKVGCVDEDVCAKSQFSLFGSFGVGKRSVEKVKRQGVDDLMVTCLQCCDGDLCNKALCGAVKTNRRRCFECRDVNHPKDCESIVECGQDEECFIRFGPLHTNHRYTYSMSCMSSAACRALTGGGVYLSNGCTACCNHTDYCNFQACDGWTTPSPATIPVNTASVTNLGSGGSAGSTAPPPQPVITGNNSAFYSHDIHLQCSVSGSVLSVKWLYNQNDPLPPMVTSSGGALDIYNLNETNKGKYTCMAVSNNGVITMANTWVTILDAPARVLNVTKYPPVVSPGQPFTIRCSVIGYPVPNVTWQFLGKDGSSTIPSLVDFSSNQKTLRIQHYANTHHDGTWTCTARNILGQSQGHVDVP